MYVSTFEKTDVKDIASHISTKAKGLNANVLSRKDSFSGTGKKTPDNGVTLRFSFEAIKFLKASTYGVEHSEIFTDLIKDIATREKVFIKHEIPFRILPGQVRVAPDELSSKYRIPKEKVLDILLKMENLGIIRRITLAAYLRPRPYTRYAPIALITAMESHENAWGEEMPGLSVNDAQRREQDTVKGIEFEHGEDDTPKTEANELTCQSPLPAEKESSNSYSECKIRALCGSKLKAFISWARGCFGKGTKIMADSSDSVTDDKQ